MSELRHDDGSGRDRWSDRLSEYLDGGMPASERERLEAHLTRCAACSVALADLRDIVERARALPDTMPADDLWPAIEARLEPRAAGRRRAETSPGPAWWVHRFDIGIPQLAAAAVLLVALTAGTMWLALRAPRAPGAPVAADRGGVARTQEVATPIPATPVAGGPDDGVMRAGLNDPRYDAAVAELERALDQGRSTLDPRTLRVVEKNLDIIDRAIDEGRRAVLADPGSTWLRSHLASTMKRKVDLLRSAAMLAGQS